jgi:chromosomal replication initiator protein
MPELISSISAEQGLQRIWEAALDIIRPRVNPSNFEKWFRPLTCLGVDDDCLILEAPNRYIKEWFEANFTGAILDALEKVGSRPYRIRIQIPRQEEVKSKPSTGSKSSDRCARISASNARSASDDQPEAGEPSFSSTRRPPSPPGAPDQPGLAHRYTFENFVVGPSNQLAEAASRAVADHPARKYNPLFIYGGVGLGKTHLLSAIGHEVAHTRPTWNVVYVTSERFVVEYINDIRTNRIDQFRKKYRHNCDILLIDDIQFIAGKDRTQEEFFHTFNALYEAGRQIVVTSDQFPHEIPGLEDRLRNRFQWGLIADIQSPELETRIAILHKKAESEGIDLPDDVAHYLASHVKTNIRELEGALIRLDAFADLQGRPTSEITIEFARSTLQHLIERPDVPLSAERIQDEVASHFDVKVNDLKGKRRHRSISYPRQIAMYLCRDLTNQSYPEIGNKFGGKDHTTVMAAFKKIKRLADRDPATRSAIDTLKSKLNV